MWLVIDTAGPVCAAGLFDGASGLARCSEEIGRGHAERLMPMIDEIMNAAKAEWRDVSRVVVTRGPGSFTGLRVGLAAARGFGLALGVPVYGVNVLDALAHAAQPEKPFTLALPAGRGDVWCGAYDAQAYPAQEPWSVADDAFTAPAGFETVLSVPNGSAPLDSIRTVAERQTVPALPPSALYLRAPDAKPQAAPVHAASAI